MWWGFLGNWANRAMGITTEAIDPVGTGWPDRMVPRFDPPASGPNKANKPDKPDDEYEKIHRLNGSYHKLVDPEKVKKNKVHFFATGCDMLCRFSEHLRYGTYKPHNVTCIDCRKALVKSYKASKKA